MTQHYLSPRWSNEVTDCSMPMTFDTYSACSYGCLYCFSLYQRANSQKRHFTTDVLAVDPERVKRIFTNPRNLAERQFWPYVQARRPMQWGGLSDQFDEQERKRGVTLELLRFCRDLAYPISFSTKSTWWTQDARYLDLFRGMPWNVKFSIITLDGEIARRVECGVDSPDERLEAMGRVAAVTAGGVTLRLRPFIIGISSRTHKELIQRAADHGATAVSTEFFCLEVRSRFARDNCYPKLSQLAGFDLYEFYRKHTPNPAGYLRLTREVKRRYVDEMQEACNRYGLRFYVSDAHFKERCANGSCCGLPATWDYSRGQFTEALQIAKAKGSVRWSDIAPDANALLGAIPWERAEGFNTHDSTFRARFFDKSLAEWLRYVWNHPNQQNAPYRYFEGVMKPIGLDSEGDVVYEYDPERA